MAETRRYLGGQLDIEQILLEAQHRWLRPAEICEILRNYKKFRIAPEPATRPPSGSLFLFDRKVLRYFRKDGHNWRKKKDGKTVKEAHERLKAGSIDVLHCYYAHGEEHESFQRRSYWMLEEELSHIVLVHYREVKVVGNRTNFNRIKDAEEATPISQETEDYVTNSDMDSSGSSKFHPYNYQASQTDTTSLNSAQASEYEDAESVYNNQASSRFQSFFDVVPPIMEKKNVGVSLSYYPAPFANDYQGKFPAVSEADVVSLTHGDEGKNNFDTGLTYEHQKYQDFPSWDSFLGNTAASIQSSPFQPSSSTQIDTTDIMSGQGNEILGQVFVDGFGKKLEFESNQLGQEQWQKLHLDSAYILDPGLSGGEVNSLNLHNSVVSSHAAEQSKHLMQDDALIQLTDMEDGCSLKLELQNNLAAERKAGYSAVKQPVLDGIMKDGLKKLDSFDRWMSKELGDVAESPLQSTTGSYWVTDETHDGIDDPNVGSQVHLESYVLSPSLSQDQLFSIIDFSPNWAYSGSEIKVLITGRFLKSQQDVENCKWACMFGELEVPAEVIADGVLRCHTPQHEAGRVPFYVTCSNRLACSEVREFEFQPIDVPDIDIADATIDSSNATLLHMRFGKLLSLGSGISQNAVASVVVDNPQLSSNIASLLKDDNNEWEHMLKLTSGDGFSTEKVREQLLEKLLKEKLHAWLLQKVSEGGKGASILDEDGQGVLHFAAALGYDWAIPATIAAGVSVNFRDVNGWTALHWAASCGRERTVAFLISLGAAPGALTDPTPKYPSGRTPADLASSNGHKGIAGYLAESSLSSHLSSLKLDTKEGSDGQILGLKAVQTISERTATPVSDGELPHGLSMKDSLAAVCNATQAAARIHQVFRVQSFQKKQLKEYGDHNFGMSDGRALSILAVKSNKAGPHDEPVHAAAIRIQNKFRSWKGRKEFLIIRQRIVKIQAHVRGHQVRKNYRNIIWSVGILEKVILRWRRKGSGLRGFKLEAPSQGPSELCMPHKEDDYDFLKEGRKQTEQRLEKALARVKSMVQYPEARDQYRRLLNVVSDMQETKEKYNRITTNSEEPADFDDDFIDLEALLDGDDTFMSTAS